MFRRVGRSTRICRRCQQQSLRTKPILNSIDIGLNYKSIRRWQSTDSSAIAAEQSAPSANSDFNHTTPARTVPHSTHPSHYVRPQPSTALGTNSLGQPAEVLILQPSDRSNTKQPAKRTSYSAQRKSRVEDSRKAPTAGQPLDAELRPITWDDVKKNIHSLRSSWKNSSAQDANEGQWQKLQSQLATGFTIKQLKKYILESAKENGGEEQVDDRILQKFDKGGLADKILSDVWKLDVEIDQIGEDPEGKRTFIKVNETALELALSDRSEPVRWLADKYGVQVDVFRATSEVEIIGSPEDSQAAADELRKLLKAPYTARYTLDEVLRGLLEGRLGDEYLKALMRRYNVRIKHPGTRLHVSSLSPEGLSLVERELAQISTSGMQEVGHSLLLGKDDLGLNQVETQLFDGQNWFHNQQTWYRNTMDNSTTAPVTPSQIHDGVSETVNVLEKAGLYQPSPVYQFYDPSCRSIRQSLTADIGQVVFNGSGSPGTDPMSLITLDVTRLPQLLASRQLVPSRNQSSAIFTFRLRPKKEQSDLPTFEVLMTGNDPSKGLKQPLQMRRVSAILAETSHDVLIPQLGADVRLTSTTALDLFLVEKPALAQGHLGLLQTFADIIKQMQAGDDGNMKLVWKVDFSGLLKRAGASEASNAGATDPLVNAVFIDGVEENLRLEQLRRASKTARYMLEAPEIQDVFMASAVINEDLQLRHIMCDAGPVERPRRRQMLLVQESLAAGNLAGVTKGRSSKKRQEAPIVEATSGPANHPIGNRRARLEQILHAAVKVAAQLSPTSSQDLTRETYS